jgi:hypothetical protein
LIESDLKQSRSLKRILGTEFASALPKTKEMPQKNSFNEKQLSFLIKETLNSKLNLNRSLDIIKEFKENFKFYSNEDLNLISCSIGEIKTKKKVTVTYIYNYMVTKVELVFVMKIVNLM